MKALASAAVLALLAVTVGGCKTYQLQGTVVEGPAPNVLVVPRDDDRLKINGLASATVSVTLDPDSLSPKNVGSTTTGPDGEFALTIGQGAGFLLYDAHVVVRRSGHQTAEGFVPLPRGNQRLLVTLPAGRDRWKPKKDFVEETLEMGEPYLD